MTRPLRRALVAALLLASAPLAGQAASDRTPPREARVTIERARLAGLGDFVDGIAAQQIATREVAGAVVTVVHRGRIVLSRGYGHADIDRGVPVDPANTLFRPGSVSKLFTWVALMQQVEAGRVSLDADVNDYIDFRIPPYQGQPIRVRDLFQHTPGMSDLGNFAAETPDRLIPYQRYLKDNIPKRLWAPGTEIAYSNYGAALAGYIVERLSGEPFPDYVDRALFRPLGMTSTVFREPLPSELSRRMALGYRVVGGRFVAQPYELYSAILPAGSAAAPASDMARFMMAMLNGGQLGGRRVLSAQGVAFLMSDGFANAPGLPGMAHGFMVRRAANPRMVGHGGNTGDFHSDLVLAPAADFGVFVSTTGGAGSYGARTELIEAVLARLFPERRTPAYAGMVQETAATGSYRANRRNYDRPANPSRDIKVTRPQPGWIAIENEGRSTAWRRTGERTYELVTGTREGGPFDRVTFYGDGARPRLSYASQPHMTWHLVRP